MSEEERQKAYLTPRELGELRYTEHTLDCPVCTNPFVVRQRRELEGETMNKIATIVSGECGAPEHCQYYYPLKEANDRAENRDIV
jgi:hypothetical protein